MRNIFTALVCFAMSYSMAHAQVILDNDYELTTDPFADHSGHPL